MKKTVLLLIIVAAIIVAGWYAVRRPSTNEDLQGLLTFVDRQIPPEHQVRLTTDIARMREEIGDRVGEAKSMEDLDRWINIGNLYFVLGNLREARAALREAVDLNPVNYVAWGNLGDTLAEIGDLEGAREAYKKAIEFSNLTVYLLKYADFLRAKFPDDHAEYERVLLGAVAARGQQPEFISRLADFYMEQGRYQDAVTHYEVLLNLTQGDVQVQRDLAAARKKLAEEQAAP